MGKSAKENMDLDLLQYEDPAFVAALRHYMASTGWSWSRLSDEIGVAVSTITEWRKNRTLPSGGTLLQISKAFDVPRSEFFATGEQLVREHREHQWRKIRQRHEEMKQKYQTAEFYLYAIENLDEETRGELFRRLQEVDMYVKLLKVTRREDQAESAAENSGLDGEVEKEDEGQGRE